MKRYALTVSKGTARLVETSDRGEETHTLPWSDDAVPASLLWELPRLFDRGLPRDLRCTTLWRNGPERTMTPARLITRVAAGSCEAQLTFGNDPQPVTLRVDASAAGRGRPQRMQSGAKARTYLKEADIPEFLDALPVLRNEWAAIETLLELRKGRGGLTPSTDRRGYRFAFRRSKTDPKRWMAVASPVVPEETGRAWFVINQDGKVFASTKPVALGEACAIPKGATAVD